MSEEEQKLEILNLTSQIVSAHVGNNALSANELPNLISQVFHSLANLGQAVESVPAEKLTPAVPIKKSVFPDYLVCLEDGKKLKMMKRHLRVSYEMTPEQYREKWGLPDDYPMVAPNYAQQRSQLAKEIGLGSRKRGPKS